MTENEPAARVSAPIYVYGVVRAGSVTTSKLEGVADGAVSTIEVDGVAALTTELPAGPLRVRRRDLDTHLQVLESVFEDQIVVPCAFGTVLQGRQSVETDFLGARREELLALLDRLDGRVQMNVKASYEEDAVLREVVAEDAEIARLRGQARALGDAGHMANIRLGELIATALGGRAAADRQRVGDRLMAESDEVVAEETAVPVVLKASFLVSRDRLRSFDAALEALAAEEAPRLVFEAIGPLPPTAFATLDGTG